MKKSNKLVALVFILSFLFTSLTPAAFAAPVRDLKLGELNLSYWVEYDQPEKWNKDDPAVLMMYNGSVVNTTTKDYQGDIGFYIPDNAQINMVCETEKGMACQPYKITKTDKGQYLTWKATRPLKPGEKFPFMVELYYNPINGTAAKTIDYTFVPSMDIDALKIDVKAPLKGANFKIEPPSSQIASDKEGFSYYIYDLTNVKAEDAKNFKISYTKEGSAPSVTATASQGQAPAETESNTSKLNLPAILGIFAFVVILGGFFFVALKGNNNNVTSKSAKKAPKNNATKTTKPKTVDSSENEKKKARKLLLEGKISEETYQEIIADLEA